MIIKEIKAREILNSRGEPTVEAEIETERGVFRGSVPSGVSRGKYEAVELRDSGARFFGQGVQKAVENIEKVIGPRLKEKALENQKDIDQILIELDGTENKSKLGANALLAVSIASCRAGAASQSLPLYKYISECSENSSPEALARPCFLVIEGGKHAGNGLGLEIQEFMVVPQMESFKENLRAGAEVYHILGEIIKKEYGSYAVNVGCEGGFAPALKETREALGLIIKAIKQAGYSGKAKIALDSAASEFYKNGKYNFQGKKLNGEELLGFYEEMSKDYPILFLEDPFSQDDWQGWKKLMSNVKCQMSNVLIIGDDLTVTNPERIKKAKEKKACDAVILKPNQIGTVTETIRAAKLAKQFGWKLVVSHRAGETEDDFIADLAVGIGAEFVKFGAPARGERTAKYNRLLRIERELYGSNGF